MKRKKGLRIIIWYSYYTRYTLYCIDVLFSFGSQVLLHLTVFHLKITAFNAHNMKHYFLLAQMDHACVCVCLCLNEYCVLVNPFIDYLKAFCIVLLLLLLLLLYSLWISASLILSKLLWLLSSSLLWRKSYLCMGVCVWERVCVIGVECSTHSHSRLLSFSINSSSLWGNMYKYMLTYWTKP